MEDLNIERTLELDVNKVCDLMGYPDPVVEFDDVRILVLDETTAIPYIVIES